MVKIICPNAKLNRVTPVYTEMSCDRGCHACHGAGYTEADAVEAEKLKTVLHGCVGCIYSEDLMDLVKV